MTEIRLGALCWNQYTDWPLLLEAGMRAERLGYDTLWTWDHEESMTRLATEVRPLLEWEAVAG